MEREEKRITESGTYKFGDNYNLNFIDDDDFGLNYCNINCGDNCLIICGWDCNITCGNNCIIDCGIYCNIACGNICQVTCGWFSYIKAGLGTQLFYFNNFLKTISKGDEFIWWYFHIHSNFHKDSNLINTYQNVNWQKKNPEKFKELYPFVHNELDSTILF